MNLAHIAACVAALLALFGIIAIGVRVIKHARGELTAEGRDRPEDLLASLQAAYEAGELDTAELERVKRTLTSAPHHADRPIEPPAADAPPSAPAEIFDPTSADTSH